MSSYYPYTPSEAPFDSYEYPYIGFHLCRTFSVYKMLGTKKPSYFLHYWHASRTRLYSERCREKRQPTISKATVSVLHCMEAWRLYLLTQLCQTWPVSKETGLFYVSMIVLCTPFLYRLQNHICDTCSPSEATVDSVEYPSVGSHLRIFLCRTFTVTKMSGTKKQPYYRHWQKASQNKWVPRTL